MSIVDLVRRINLGNEFDIGNIVATKIKLKIDATLRRELDGTIGVVRPPLAAVDIDVQDVNDNGAITFTAARTDIPWTIAANTATYTGQPDRVRINAQIHQAIANDVNIVRPNPVLELYRNGTLIATSASAYIRDQTDHEESSNTIAMTDHAPGTNPSYTFQSRQETTQGGVVTSQATSTASFEAVV